MVKISCKIREYLLNKYNRPTNETNWPTDTIESRKKYWELSFADLVADQFENRIPFRRAIREALLKNISSLDYSQRQILLENYPVLRKIMFPSRNPYESNLYEQRCQCNKKRILSRDDSGDSSQDRNIQIALIEYVKKRNLGTRSQPKLLQYPELDPELALDETGSKIFQIKCEKKLSSIAKLVLNSFQNKYIYYAVDDLLYLLKSVPTEHEDLLSILYSPIISLQNNFSINFFDIWIHEIYVAELPKFNKFLNTSSSNVYPSHYITIKLLYKTKVPIKKIDSLW